jgi:hypothetical protein
VQSARQSQPEDLQLRMLLNHDRGQLYANEDGPSIPATWTT